MEPNIGLHVSVFLFTEVHSQTVPEAPANSSSDSETLSLDFLGYLYFCCIPFPNSSHECRYVCV